MWGGSRGFTLLEVLGAVAILGIGLALLFQVFGNGLRTTAKLEAVSYAAVQARALLDQALLDPDPAGAADSGELPGGFRYRVTVEPFAETEFMRLFRVSVDVSQPAGNARVSLSTLKTADADANS